MSLVSSCGSGATRDGVCAYNQQVDEDDEDFEGEYEQVRLSGVSA